VFSGREATWRPGKDTGRYWDAGASNVHWVVGTDSQIALGFGTALEPVRGPGVFIEGNSFLKYADADFSIMVVSPSLTGIKSSAMAILPKMNAIYISQHEPESWLIESFQSRLERRGARKLDLDFYFGRDCERLSDQINRIVA